LIINVFPALPGLLAMAGIEICARGDDQLCETMLWSGLSRVEKSHGVTGHS
jgi:hypothetical protein